MLGTIFAKKAKIDGKILQRLEYTPYGSTAVEESSGSATTGVTHKFTGKELDETGLYYYGARYYDPTLGRFITPDTIVQSPFDPQTLNRYTYCRSNPVKYTDPSGHFFWFIPLIIAVVKGAIIGSLIGGALAAVTGGNIGQGFLTGAVSGAIFGGIGWGVGQFGLKGLAVTAAHALGGSASGAINASITGDDVGMGALIGGASAGAGQWIGANVPFLEDSPIKTAGDLIVGTARHAVTGAIVGGGISAAFGGDFGYGARQGAMTSAIAYNANFAAAIALDFAIAGLAIMAIAVINNPQTKASFERLTNSLNVHQARGRYDPPGKMGNPLPLKGAPGPDYWETPQGQNQPPRPGREGWWIVGKILHAISETVDHFVGP